MSKKWPLWRKLAGLIVLLLILGFGFLFLVEPVVEKRESEKIAAFLSSLPGDWKAEKITANFLEKNFIISNLHGTLKGLDGPDMEISVLEIAIDGINEDAVKTSGVVSLIMQGQITHVTVKTAAFSAGTVSAPAREMHVERLFFHDVRGNAASLPVGDKSKKENALLQFLSSLSFSDLSVFGYTDKASTTGGAVFVSAQSANFKGGANTSERGSLGDVGKLMLPGLLAGQAGSSQDKQAIADARAQLAENGGGELHITMQPVQPVPMAQLAKDGAVTLNVKAETGTGR